MDESGLQLEIRLLGAPEVRAGGGLVEVAGRRRRALLVALALAPGKGVSVDRLVDAVWGEDPPENAATTLHSHVSRLRTALDRTGERSLVARRGEAYLLDVEPIAVDAHRFEQLVADARALFGRDQVGAASALAAALALWHGPALGEFANDDFARPTAVRLEELRLNALEELADLELALGRIGEAIPRLEAAVREHPLRERYTSLLMTALYRGGRGAEASRAFERTRSLLADELGLSPSPDLAALNVAILNQSLELPGPPPEVPLPAADPTPDQPRRLPAAMAGRRLGPFVGRTEEMSVLAKRWEATLAGDGGVVAVVGEAGRGKTRLVNEFARSVHERGATVLWGRCTPELLTRYQPFVEALEPLVSAGSAFPTPPLLRLLFPDRDGAVAPQPEREVDRYALFSAVTELLRNHAAIAPVLLVVDDAQWADASTTALAVHVARHCLDVPVLLAATYRSAEVAGTHPAAEALAELRRDRLIEMLDLPALRSDDVAALVGYLRPDATPENRSAIAERSEGNPFFVEELTVESTGEPLSGLPLSVRAVLDRRLARLEELTVRRLRSAAVLGREFDLDVVAEVTETVEMELLDDLEAALDAALVTEVPGVIGRFAFAHALVREALVDGMSGLRRRHLHRAAAQAISRRDPSGARAAEVAVHLVAAGFDEDRAEAARQLFAAGSQAAAVFAHQESVALLQKALELGTDGVDEGLRCDIRATLGSALLTIGERQQAQQHFAEAIDLARQLGDPERFALAVTRPLFGVGLGISGPYFSVDERSVALLEEALNLLTSEKAERLEGDRIAALRVWVLSYLACLLYHAPEPARRESAAKEAMSLAAATGDPASLATAHVGQQLVLGTSPDADPDERLALAEAARLSADAAGSPGLRVVCRLQALPVLLETGDFARFDSTLAEAQAIMSPLGQSRTAWYAEIARGARALLDGRYPEAAVRIDRAFRDIGKLLGDTPFGTRMLQLAVLERDTGAASLTADRLVGPGLLGPGRAIVRAVAGIANVEAGRPDAARELYERDASERFATVPRDEGRLAALVWFGELACLLGDRAGAAALDASLAGMETRWAPVHSSCCAGPVARARGLVATLLGDTDAAARFLRLALSESERVGARPWAARCGAELGVVLRRSGDRAGAASKLAAAQQLADEIGLVLPPALLVD